MTITVGFSPASAQPASAVTAKTAAGAQGGEGMQSLFAMLLGLLGGNTGEAAAQLPDTIADLFTGAASSAPLTLDAAAPDPATDGNALLSDLGSLLGELANALETGEPIDPALKEKLSETLDAVAAAFNLPQTPPPPPGAGEAALAAALDGDALLPTPDAASPADAEDTAELARIAEQFARRLGQEAPELGRRIEATLRELGGHNLPKELLQALGIDPDLKLTPSAPGSLTGAKQTAGAATNPFAAPTLDTPETLATPMGDGATDKAGTDPAEKRQPGSMAPRDLRIDQADAKPTGPAQPATTDPAATATAQPASASTAAMTPAGARVIHAAYQAPVQQLNLPAIAFDIVRHVEAGNSRFQIRLDPPELGRIDVRLDVDKSGAVHARLTVDRAETLDLMQRDQRALQQALQQAGLDGNKTNLEFSLRQNPFSAGGDTGNGGGQQSAPGFAGDRLAADLDASDQPAAVHYRGTTGPDGVNLFV
ncbi:flagellar hook-length control protein FliK [Devosia sp.]|uniref:flagellar hook-length control protein FliK n=1 Tax=Devosia sp. TaxID=1871048 RepID=UPI003A917A88